MACATSPRGIWCLPLVAVLFLLSSVAAGARHSAAVLSSNRSVSAFLGALTDEQGVFSLAFSLGDSDDKQLVKNTFFVGAENLGKYARSAGGGVAASSRAQAAQRQGSLRLVGGAQIQWDDDEEAGVVTVRASFANASSSQPYGGTFSFAGSHRFYGVWEYPWNGSITNNYYGAITSANATESDQAAGQAKADIGIYGTQPGINWSNARAPFFFVDSGLGVYVDTNAPVTFRFREQSSGANVSVGFPASVVTYKILYGQPSIKGLLQQYAKQSSYPLFPAEAGYGPIFWSDDFEQDFHDSSVKNAQDNYFDVADHLEQNGIRATAFFADRPYGTGNQSFGNFDFDPKFYPSPAAFIAGLAKRGYAFQAWVANRAFLNTKLYNDSASHHWLFPGVDPSQYLGPALNLSIPAAYDYFRDQLTTFVTKYGVRGFKIDRGEEHELPDAAQNTQTGLFLQLCEEAVQKAWGGGKSSSAAPPYGNSTSSSSSSSTPSYFNFARNAFDRDRSRVAIWNGDSQATFEGLRYTVASGIRAGLLGFSHWGSDTGGYIRDAGGPSEALFARWMQFAAWTPMYEVLVGLKHTPWYEYSPELVSILKKTTDQHTRLIPYLRSIAYEASTTGVPAMRALFLEFPDDPEVWETADAYMLGGAFYVVPVVEEDGSRVVRLPNSTTDSRQFLEYFGKLAAYLPGATHDIMDVSIESQPVFVLEGSIVPTGDVYRGNADAILAAAAAAAGTPVSSNGTVGSNATHATNSSITPKWSPHLSIEVYPSFDIPEKTFTYYRGREAAAQGLPSGPALITVKTDKANNRTVTVQAEDLGVANATVVIYQKTAEGYLTSETVPLPRSNETLVRTGVYSLWE